MSQDNKPEDFDDIAFVKTLTESLDEKESQELLQALAEGLDYYESQFAGHIVHLTSATLPIHRLIGFSRQFGFVQLQSLAERVEQAASLSDEDRHAIGCEIAKIRTSLDI